MNSFVTADNHDDFRERVRSRKVDGLFAFLGHGESRESDISLARCDRIDNCIEFNVLNFNSAVEVIGNVIHDFDIETDNLCVLVVFVRRELSVGRNHKLRAFGHLLLIVIIARTINVRIEERIVNAILLHRFKRLVHRIQKRFVALRDNACVHFFDEDFFENAERRILEHESLGGLVVTHDRVNLPLQQRLHGIGKFRVAFDIDFRRVATKVRRVDIGSVAYLHAHLFVAEIADGMNPVGDDGLFLALARCEREREQCNKKREI